MRINSKKKGSKNERVGANLFEEWMDVEVVRVPQSGGLGWSSGLMITGDIIPANPTELAIFPFSVEMKFYTEITFQDLILPNNSQIQKFWDQSFRDAKKVGKLPLVLFRYNRMKKELFFVVLGYRAFVKVKKLMELPNGYFNYKNKFVIFTSDNLFNTDYDEFIDCLNIPISK